jgi:hypothetical protein
MRKGRNDYFFPNQECELFARTQTLTFKVMGMKFVLVTRDEDLVAAAKEGFHPSDKLKVCREWRPALDCCQGADMMFVDLIATLDQPNKIAGYVEFANAKMEHPVACGIPLVVISPDPLYELDYFVGWPNFAFANLQRPLTFKHFRRASTWV